MTEIRMAELFAGVGGFRLGLEGYDDSAHPEFHMPTAGPYKTAWANQWEPPGTESKQYAWRCYEERFGKGSCVNEDIEVQLDEVERGVIELPDVDLVTGGFPCQDYSVARPLPHARGINGKKGVLWWQIYRFLTLAGPRFGVFENVDRLLKSPANQRGRDFAIMLACLHGLDYSVEWRVVNSAEYGFPQRRKRIYIVVERNAEPWDLEWRLRHGTLARALPIHEPSSYETLSVSKNAYEVSETFNLGGRVSPFLEAGAMQDGKVVTCKIEEDYSGPRKFLGDVLIPEEEVPDEFYIPEEQMERWRYLKGSKSEPRVNRRTGFEYHYSEGAMSFPDALDRPSRTILTGEGGRGASRFKHVVRVDGRYRRLVPDELDRLQGFPAGWTDTGMTDGQRAFCMGNALVVGIPHLIGRELAREVGLA